MRNAIEDSISIRIVIGRWVVNLSINGLSIPVSLYIFETFLVHIWGAVVLQVSTTCCGQIGEMWCYTSEQPRGGRALKSAQRFCMEGCLLASCCCMSSMKVLFNLHLLSRYQTDMSSLYVLFVWSLCPGGNSLVVLSSVIDLLPSGMLGLAWF